MPSFGPSVSHDGQNPSLYILPIITYSLAIPTRARQAPKVEKVAKRASLKDDLLRLTTLDLTPGVGFVVVGVHFDEVGSVESARIFVLK